MPQESFHWIGNHYDCSETRLLLLAAPDNLSDLPTKLAENVLADFAGATDLMRKLSQGLAGKRNPSQNLLHRVWHRVAFTYYVAETKSDFCSNILNKLRPRRIIVLGKDMWSQMPNVTAKDVYMTDDVQGYSLEDGAVAVCFALDDPATRNVTWTRLADTIHFALGGKLPRDGRCPVDGE